MEKRWLWPLPGIRRVTTVHRTGDGAFGHRRRYDMHTGVDLYCNPGQIVRAVETGQVVWVGLFTGEKAQSPWWNDTRAVMIKGESGILLYGELQEKPWVVLGATVTCGEEIGNILTVRKQDRGKPMTMLHFEKYDETVKEPVWWYHDEPKPAGLMDPTDQLAWCEGE